MLANRSQMERGREKMNPICPKCSASCCLEIQIFSHEIWTYFHGEFSIHQTEQAMNTVCLQVT